MASIWYGDHRGILVFDYEEDFGDGTFVKMIVWQVPKDAERPHGYKYRLHFGTLAGSCIVRYDNRRGKGDHRHLGEEQQAYEFVDTEQLISDFWNDVQRYREEKLWLNN